MDQTLDSTLAVLWGRPAAPTRGPKPTLTLATIAEAGIRLADADGLAAVTMQTIAAELGVTKMALYRYVPGKAELVALMTDTALGQPPRPADGDWRAALHTWSHRLYEGFRRHPWTLHTTVGVRVMGPNELAWLEHAAAALSGTGLRGGEVLDVAATLAGHVRGIAQQATGSDTPEAALGEAIGRVLAEHADRFPALSAAYADAGHPQDQALTFGLDRILDGVELLIARRR